MLVAMSNPLYQPHDVESKAAYYPGACRVVPCGYDATSETRRFRVDVRVYGHAALTVGKPYPLKHNAAAFAPATIAPATNANPINIVGIAPQTTLAAGMTWLSLYGFSSHALVDNSPLEGDMLEVLNAGVFLVDEAAATFGPGSVAMALQTGQGGAGTGAATEVWLFHRQVVIV